MAIETGFLVSLLFKKVRGEGRGGGALIRGRALIRAWALIRGNTVLVFASISQLVHVFCSFCDWLG